MRDEIPDVATESPTIDKGVVTRFLEGRADRKDRDSRVKVDNIIAKDLAASSVPESAIESTLQLKNWFEENVTYTKQTRIKGGFFRRDTLGLQYDAPYRFGEDHDPYDPTRTTRDLKALLKVTEDPHNLMHQVSDLYEISTDGDILMADGGIPGRPSLRNLYSNRSPLNHFSRVFSILAADTRFLPTIERLGAIKGLGKVELDKIRIDYGSSNHLVYIPSLYSQIDTAYSEVGISYDKKDEDIDEPVSKLLKLNDDELEKRLKPEVIKRVNKFIERISVEVGTDGFSPHMIPGLLEMAVNESVFTEARQSELIEFIKDEENRDFLYRNLIIFAHVEVGKMQEFIQVFNSINNSSIPDILKLKDQLIREIASSANPLHSWNLIQSVFAKNHLPLTGKALAVFEILHTPQAFEKKWAEAEKRGATLSPVLKSASMEERYAIFRNDLLKVHLETGNPSLIRYLRVYSTGISVFTKAETEGVGSLNQEDQERLSTFLDRMDTLYSNMIRGRTRSHVGVSSKNRTDQQVLERRMSILKRRYGISSGEQSLDQKMQEIFLGGLGFKNIEEALDATKKKRDEARIRNRDAVEGGSFKMKEGDLLKGVKHRYLVPLMQGGIVSNEFFGNDSDRTPWDTDTSRVLKSDLRGINSSASFAHAFNNSLARDYGKLILIIRPDERYVETHHGESSKYDPSKYEIFSSNVHGERHVGLRSGASFREVIAMIAVKELVEDKVSFNRVCFHISQDDLDISILNEKGSVIFGEHDREKFLLDPNPIIEALNSDDYNPAVLIEAFKKNLYLRDLYNSDAGIQEGWTIEQHTGMVLNNLPDKLNTPLFKAILALHDIGKPESIAFTGGTKAQHEFTRQIVERVFSKLGFDDHDVDVAVAITSQDHLGQLLNPKYDRSPTLIAEDIKNEAIALGLDSSEYFDLLVEYYRCDTGAYTTRAEYTDKNRTKFKGKSSLDHLFKNAKGLEFSDEVESRIRSLRALV